MEINAYTRCDIECLTHVRNVIQRRYDELIDAQRNEAGFLDGQIRLESAHLIEFLGDIDQAIEDHEMRRRRPA